MALAEGPDELWELTINMEMAGMPAMPARTSKVCKKKGDQDLPQDPCSDCKMTDMKRSGNWSTRNMACTKPEPMTGSGDMTYNGDSYQGTIKLTGGDMNLTQTLAGKKVGTCTYEEPCKRVNAIQEQSKAVLARERDKRIEELQPM